MTYGLFDALGKPGLRTDGPVTLESLFDRAGRMTLQFEPSAGNRNWKRYVYGGSNVGGPNPNWKLGRVERAIGYNYLPGSPGLRVRFEEDFVYAGPGGRASGRTVRRIDNVLTSPLGPDLPGEVFTHAESFDALGQRTSVTYPACVPASANCDAGSASPRTVTSTHAFGRLTSVPGWVSQITYHPNGSWNQLQHANGVTDLQGMGNDRRQRPASLETKRATTTLWRAGTFAYDDAGNILTMGPTEQGGIDRFLYDGVSRLREARLYVPEGESPDLIFTDGFESGDTSAWGGTAPLSFAGETARTRRFRYDVHANLIEVEEVGGSTLNLPTDSTSNRLLAPLATYSDGRGNQTSHGPTQFAYDALDRMASRTAGGTTTYFGYTADGERIVSYVAQENDFHWALRDLGGKLLRTFGLEELTEEPPTIALRPRWDHLFAGDRAIGAEAPLAPPGTTRIHQSLDHLGTPRLLTDAAGNVRPNGRRKYLPYGEDAVTPTTQTGPTLAFTGHERDLHDTTGPEDDLDYLHARFRSPLTGRFLSVDPAPGNPSAPQSWNRYTYVMGNPLSYTDPTGELTAAQIARNAQEALALFRHNIGAATSDGSTAGAISTAINSTVVDVLQLQVSGAAELLTAGEATGTALGSGAGAGATAFAIGGDLLRTAALVAPMIGGARALASRGGIVAIDDVLSGLRDGRGAGVKMTDSAEELESLFRRLSRGGKPLERTTYPGRMVELPDGTRVGMRSASSSGGPTIDIHRPTGPPSKIHVGGGS